MHSTRFRARTGCVSSLPGQSTTLTPAGMWCLERGSGISISFIGEIDFITVTEAAAMLRTQRDCHPLTPDVPQKRRDYSISIGSILRRSRGAGPNVSSASAKERFRGAHVGISRFRPAFDGRSSSLKLFEVSSHAGFA